MTTLADLLDDDQLSALDDLRTRLHQAELSRLRAPARRIVPAEKADEITVLAPRFLAPAAVFLAPAHL